MQIDTRHLSPSVLGVPTDPMAWLDSQYPPLILPVSDAFDLLDLPQRPQDELTFKGGDLHISIERWAASSNDALVTIGVVLNNEVWEVTGHAHRDRSDVGNKDAGLLLALSKALKVAAGHVEKHALGKMKHDADMVAQRKFYKPGSPADTGQWGRSIE